MSPDKVTRLRRVLAHQEQIAAQNKARLEQNEAGLRAFFDFFLRELCGPDAHAARRRRPSR